MELSVILPAYNEAVRIGASIVTVSKFLDSKNWDYEIIIVDDGSADSTAEIAERAAAENPRIKLLRNGRNRGKGYSVRRGMLEASKAHRLFTDADLPIPIEEIEKFAPLADSGCDVLIGSRKAAGHESESAPSLLRRFFSAGFNLIVRALVLRGVRDTQCGFKLFSARAAEEIFSRLRLEYFGFDVEALAIAKLLGFETREIGIRLSNPKESSVNVLISPVKMFAEILRLRANIRRGLYK